MHRTLKLQISVTPNDRDILLRTIEQFNLATNYCARWAHEHCTSDKRKVHDGTYYDVRKKFGLPASLTTAARDVACEALRAIKLRKLPKFRPYGSVRYNKRVINVRLERREASIATINGRVMASFTIP